MTAPAPAAGGGERLAHHEHPERGTPEGAENYAKAIYNLQGTGGETVGTGAVAERLGVTPASASAMLRRLGEDGIVEHAPYRGVSLTDAGRRLALRMIRRHRLLELFLARELGIPWDRVHREAEVLEHHLSDELVDAIARKLGDPDRDPHGDPIPDAGLRLTEPATLRLSELEVGRRATFVRVSDQDPEMLRHLTEQGVAPGEEFELLDRQPFGGPVIARFPAGEISLGWGLAEAMRVEPVE